MNTDLKDGQDRAYDATRREGTAGVLSGKTGHSSRKSKGVSL